VAKELSIHENALYKWINQASDSKEDAFPGSGNLNPEAEETRKLKH